MSLIPKAVDRRIARRILSSVGEGVVICDSELRVVYANDAVGSLLQLAPARMEGHDALALIHPADRALAHREFSRCLTNPEATVRAQFRVIVSPGDERRVDAIAINRRRDPAICGVLVTFRDVTERWQAREQLRESETMHRELIEFAVDAIVTADACGAIRHANATACDLTGYSREELLALKTHELYAPHEQDLARAALEVLRRGDPIHVRRTLRRKDGSFLAVDVHSRRLHDGRIHAIIRDVSVAAAGQQRAERIQRLEALGTLAASVGHDFNNLLTVIMSSASSVLPVLDRSSEEAECIEDLLAAAQSGAELVRRLIRGTRSDRVVVAECNVATMIGSIERSVRHLLPSNVSWTSRIAPELPAVHANHIAMEECMLNLVANARDAMPSGGELHLDVSIADMVGNDVDHELPGERPSFVAFELRDTGTGMDDATLRRIFEPYFTTKPVERGSGLGLAAVYRLMKEQGGFVTARSKAGHGATFTLYLRTVDSVPA